MKVISQNKKARHDYFIEETYEAGIQLLGSEIKSIRTGKVTVNDSFVTFRGGEAFVHNLHIAKYDFSSIFNHEETRPRKLLLHKKEILKMFGKTREQGYTIVPLKVYLKEGLCKVEIGLAKGKRDYDKRESLKEKDQNMRMKKILKGSR
ncbi:MAG: SsrA-binding protein [Tenericutes bacterium GWE2_38_8]|nr:MAG: SsrA-binding protein [Tenericutes bacterium GWD2_38_27]OHE36173.1 MAG: SsrA-binding protein [Tenericutes bacterium GWE2_38_8]